MFQMLERIHGYYKTFPPENMNVLVKKNDMTSANANASRGQSRLHTLVAAKDFKAGDVIYVVRICIISTLPLALIKIIYRKIPLLLLWMPMSNCGVRTALTAFAPSRKEWLSDWKMIF